MSEKLKFVPSGLVKNPEDLAEIEYWGHDAGEFVEFVVDLIRDTEETANGENQLVSGESEEGMREEYVSDK